MIFDRLGMGAVVGARDGVPDMGIWFLTWGWGC